MDLFVSLWLLAQPLLVICYLCIATVHQKLWLAGVELDVLYLLFFLVAAFTNILSHNTMR